MTGSNIRKDIEMNCMVVFPFPYLVTLIFRSSLFSAMNCLVEEIAISLKIINIVGISKIIWLFIVNNHIRVRQVNNLSATKSSRAPRLVTLLVFLAIYPSR